MEVNHQMLMVVFTCKNEIGGNCVGHCFLWNGIKQACAKEHTCDSYGIFQSHIPLKHFA